ncbi:hypothetical protein ACFQL5_19565, partial [Aquipuribacter hungaricus]
CTYLSAVLLLGLVLNATLGWSWADPVAGLVIAAVAVKEGVEAWRGDSCCSPVPSAGADPAGCSDGCSPGCTAACCSSAPGADAAPAAGDAEGRTAVVAAARQERS